MVPFFLSPADFSNDRQGRLFLENDFFALLLGQGEMAPSQRVGIRNTSRGRHSIRSATAVTGGDRRAALAETGNRIVPVGRHAVPNIFQWIRKKVSVTIGIVSARADFAGTGNADRHSACLTGALREIVILFPAPGRIKTLGHRLQDVYFQSQRFVAPAQVVQGVQNLLLVQEAIEIGMFYVQAGWSHREPLDS